MLRFDNCICGTTTTGTGTLALAATPSPPGGIDFDVWARANGFGNSAVLIVPYEIIEFTDATWATKKQAEKGVGTLTLGASAGIANATLARTTVQETATSLNAPPASVSVSSPGGTALTGITIGTASHVLVMIAASAQEIFAAHPYFDSGVDTNWGVWPDGFQNVTSLNNSLVFSTSGSNEIYVPFRWSVPMLVKRLSFRVQTYTSPTGTPIVNPRIYLPDPGNQGRPGRLLIDFGNSATITATGLYSCTATNAVFLPPGDYWTDFNQSGITAGTVALAGGPGVGSAAAVRLGAYGGESLALAGASGGSNGTPAPNPAVTTGWTNYLLASVAPPTFGLNPA